MSLTTLMTLDHEQKLIANMVIDRIKTKKDQARELLRKAVALKLSKDNPKTICWSSMDWDLIVPTWKY